MAVGPAPEPPLDPLIPWILTQAGLDASAYRAAPQARRLPACLRALRCVNPAQALALLQQRPELLPTALDALLLGVTSFYRDPPVFDALRTHLPRLAKHRPGLRVWSAACSDGAELYTVALLLADLNLLDNSELLGTDCRPDALVAARAGLYEPESLASLPLVLRQRYFVSEGSRRRICPSLRAAARFQCHDLLTPAPAGPWDLILWRNSAIYLCPGAARGIWRRLADALRPGGLLVTGKAEQPEGVALERLSSCLFVKPVSPL